MENNFTPKMSKETWLQLLRIQNSGFCNMLDINCIRQHIHAVLTHDELKEYVDHYSDLKEYYGTR